MTIDLDSDVANADWTKRYTWDLPTTADGLLAYLGQIGMSVEHFKTLPVYTVNQHRFAWLADLAAPPKSTMAS